MFVKNDMVYLTDVENKQLLDGELFVTQINHLGDKGLIPDNYCHVYSKKELELI